MSEMPAFTAMPISEARDRIGEVVGRARYAGQATILTHYGAPAAVVISFEEYQKLRHAGRDDGEYQLPPEILAQIEHSRDHPELSSDHLPPRRTPRRSPRSA